MTTNDCMVYYLYDRMNSYNPNIHQIDTSQGTALTVFDGSCEDESKLATQFWNSVVLIPPVESTLVCKEIKQRIRGRTLNDGPKKTRFSTTKTKAKEEKSMRDQLYDEAAVLQQAEDEAKRLYAVEKRNEQVRELFRKQAKVNRFKNEQLIVPQFVTYPVNTHHQRSLITFQEEINHKKQEDDDDRQLVCSLPD